MAATKVMVLLVSVTCARSGGGGKVGIPCAWVGAGVKTGVLSVWDREAGDVGVSYLLVLVRTSWHACVGNRLSEAAGLVLCWGSRIYISAWTYNIATDDARLLMLSRIWSS